MGHQRRGFIRSYVLPALFLFAIPLLGYWFFGHASRSYDEKYRAAVLAEIEEDRTLPIEQRSEARDFYQRTPASLICEHGNAAATENMDICSSYAQFRWMRRASAIGLLLGASSVVLALVCAAAAFLSRGAQYVCFLVGWNVFRVTSSIQVVIQGAIALALSYWMTALWLERFFVKIILLVGVAMAIGIYKMVVALFRKVDDSWPILGELIREEDAPELWANVRRICAELATEPPRQIVAGIDDNFFVTEGKLSLTGTVLQGRTLYVSLTLLKTLERSEADAVLAHEMAHFSGGDTQFSKRLSPLLHRYDGYLEGLAEGILTRPVFLFMLLYRALFSLSLGRTSRQREYRADQLAAKLTGAANVAKALLRVGAYSSYRSRVEQRLFEHDEHHNSIGIAQRVATGFTAYVAGPELVEDLQGDRFPHPFDTHPQLQARISALAAEVPTADYPNVLGVRVEATWYDAIKTATDAETRMWEAYEQRFASAHDRDLAFRFEPANDQERAHVERYFPPQTFQLKNGGELKLNYATVSAPEWSNDLLLDDIESCSVEERMFKKYLNLKLVSRHPEGQRSICLNEVTLGGDGFLDAFGRYYQRHLAMRAYRSR